MAKIINVRGQNQLNTPLGGNIVRNRLLQRLLAEHIKPRRSEHWQRLIRFLG